MSVEDKLHRLVIARDNIRTALEGQGIDASNHGFEGFAEDIGDIEKLSDVDVVAFGDNPTLPDKGKTNPANYEAIADAINAARARPNAVTLEPLSVTENGVYPAPPGKAYSSVTVAVPGYTVIKTTYTQVSETLSAEIPMPNGGKLPCFIDVLNAQSGTQLTDFTSGALIHIFYMPVPNDDINDVTEVSGAVRYRNETTGKKSTLAQVQRADNNVANGDYYIKNGVLKTKPGSGCIFRAGDTFNISWYYKD